MPQLVACPSCGCKVQAGESLLGRRTRCIACGNVFVASDAPAVPFPDEPQTYPLLPDEQADAPPPRQDDRQRGPARHRLPLCPRCHRPVEWNAPACPHCSHLLDTDDRTAPPAWQRRRDGEDHRGPLIDSLGTICLMCAVMGLCTGGLGVLMALCTGIPALVMASGDLARMRSGELDAEGAPATEMGRNKAIAGLVLAVVFGAVVVLVSIQTIFY
jgi:hypothetical protein